MNGRRCLDIAHAVARARFPWADVDDLTQEGALALWTAQPHENIAPTVAARAMVDAIRRWHGRRPLKRVPLHEQTADVDVERTALARIELAETAGRLTHLTDVQRAAVLAPVRGTQAAHARQAGVTPSAVSHARRTALARLR